jgi:hypothetical protein
VTQRGGRACGSIVAADVREALAPASWSSWVSLAAAPMPAEIPPRPELYRIRGVGSCGLDYVGQTGRMSMTLRKRLAAHLELVDDPRAAALVVPSRAGRPFDPSTVYKRADAAWRADGLARITLHEARHTFARRGGTRRWRSTRSSTRRTRRPAWLRSRPGRPVYGGSGASWIVRLASISTTRFSM